LLQPVKILGGIAEAYLAKRIIQSISVVNFNKIGLFLTSLRCPKVLGQKGPKIEDFEKMKEKQHSQVFMCQIST